MNKDLLIQAAKLSRGVYQGIPGSIPFDANGVQGCVIEIDGICWVVFRGTDEASDWGKNLNTKQETVPFVGNVHAGFWSAWLSVRDLVCDAVMYTSKRLQKKIIITGHSMGGALAAICAADMFYWNPDVYTFGQPRAGNAWFCERLLGLVYYRFVNSGDLVTQAPTGWRFDHTGHEVWFDQDGNRGHPSKWDRFSEWGKSLFSNLIRRRSPALQNHDMDRYLRNIQGMEIG
jgi:predicted lipase